MNSKKIDKEQNGFPKLMINDDREIIILATRKKNDDTISGIVVWANNLNLAKDSFWNADRFYDYNGQVILSNNQID